MTGASEADTADAPDRATIRRSLLALLPPLVAFVVQALLWPFFHPLVWFLLYPAVFLSAWIGGLRPALLASALSALAALWFFASPDRSFRAAPVQYFAAAVFVATGVLFGMLQERLRRANRRTVRAMNATERMNAQLRRASEAVTSLLEQAPDGILVASEDGRFTDVNHAGCRMLGRSRDEIVGRRLADLVPADIVERVAREDRELREGAREVAEWTLLREDGTCVPVEVSARILPDGRWQGFFRDISGRRELERALRAKHADLQRAQSVAGVGSWRLDVRRGELAWSDENYRILGVPPGTPMTYEDFLARVHPEDRALVDRAWNAALRGEPYDIEHRVLVDGDVAWVRERAELERDESGTVTGGIGITHDITERKRYEEELRTAQERLELALRGADLGTWDWNIETGEVLANPRWFEMRGYGPGELTLHVDSWMAGIHPDDLSRVRAILDDYLQGRIPEYEHEYRARTKSGEWIWILDRGKVFARDARGRPTRMAGTELDVTARKRAEEALRVEQAKASGLIATSVDAIISVDEEQRIMLYNEGAERMFGYSVGEAIGAPLDILIPERFREVHRELVRRFAAGAQVARRMGERGAAIFGLRKSGEEFPADAAISKISVDGATILSVSVRDVTEQKRIEREQRFLAEVGAVFASTLDYEETLNVIARLSVRDLADFCFIDIVRDGAVHRHRVESRDAGKAWIAALFKSLRLDRTRPHLMAEALHERRPVLIERVSPELLRAFAQSDEHLRALRALDPKSLIVVPLLAHENLLGAMALVSSTESRRYRASDLRLAEDLAVRAALAIENARLYRVATRAIQARDEVVGIVAHDLRNPLGAIVMQAALLQRPPGEPERRARRPAEAIVRAAGRMDRLINDLLDLTCIEAGQLAIEASAVPTARVVSDVVESQKTLAAAASIELVCDLPPALPDVWADRERLLQVFENLIGNAVKFTKAGGRVTVGARQTDGEIVFRVADTGAGIPPDVLPHVFDRFWQAEQSRRVGVGLGLSIVQGIVEAHGGRVWVESTVGRGTTCFFAIPTAPRVKQRPEAAPRGHLGEDETSI